MTQGRHRDKREWHLQHRRTAMDRALQPTRGHTVAVGARLLPALVAPPEFSEFVTRHYKLTRYDLGPLSCAVCGAYRASFNEEAILSPQVSEVETRIRLWNKKGSANRAATAGLASVIEAGSGTPVSETAAFHIMSRTTGKVALRHWTKWWLSRYGYCLTAISHQPVPGDYEQTFLSDVQIEPLGPLLLDYERQNQARLRAGVTLLSRLRDVVAEAGGPCMATLIPPRGSNKEKSETTLNVYRATRTAPVMRSHQRTELWS